MYLRKAKIENVRAITEFELTFDKPAGWHVLIGDNGAGKSTIIRSLALALVGDRQAQALRLDWNEWLNRSAVHGQVRLDVEIDQTHDAFWLTDRESVIKATNGVSFETDFRRIDEKEVECYGRLVVNNHPEFSDPKKTFIGGFFSAAYGPYRRFRGGSLEYEDLFVNSNFWNLTAHLSAFDESVGLTEVVKWLIDLSHKTLERKENAEYTLINLKKLINSKDFLPHQIQLEEINSEGVFFRDANGQLISVNQLSDGYRSILSMTFELIRQLVRSYGADEIFKKIAINDCRIDVPGVILIDEIDAHLHPTWQTRIGQWFTKYFPQLQFIVTTHSPLICRAAEHGSIWRLATPGSDKPSSEITGPDKHRLIYGNILDAYGTEVFGDDVSISKESIRKQEDLARLSKKKMLDDISPAEEARLSDLRKVFTTDAPIEL